MIGIKTANIYINFSEIMEEELKDLWEFINEEHIVAKDVTKEVVDLQQRIDKAIEYINKHKRNVIIPITNEEYEHLDDENICELLSILKGDNENG